MSDFYSNVLTVNAPGNFTPNGCGTNPKDITVCWSEASSTWGSGSKPSYYQVEWLNPTAYGTSC